MSASIIEVEATTVEDCQPQFDYDTMISDPSDREWAESAAGFITFGLGKAVVKVLEAGNLLREAKQRLPHGEYLPWVQQACGLRPNHASQLIKAAEWANVQHVEHLEGVTDTATLFLLSADATPDDLREWFMERCAAGDVPSRAEVAERKRRAAGKPAAPRPVELQALTMYRKAQTADTEAALLLARQITTVSEAELLGELGLRELPKTKVLHAMDADFHRRPDGGGWDRVPHSGRVEVEQQASPDPEPAPPQPMRGTVQVRRAAEILKVDPIFLSSKLSRGGGTVELHGWRITKVGHGKVEMERISPE